MSDIVAVLVIPEWRPVLGWEGLYEVAADGRVRSVPRRVVQRDGKAIHPRHGPLKPHPHPRGGYRRVTLRAPGRRRNVFVHDLVLEAFVGPRPDGAEARHIDGCTANNHTTNLAWGTPAENMGDRIRHGHGAYPDGTIVEALRLHATGRRNADIARCLGMSRSHVGRIVNGKLQRLTRVDGRLVEVQP